MTSQETSLYHYLCGVSKTRTQSPHSDVPLFRQFHNIQCRLTSHKLLGIVLIFFRWVFVLDQWVFVLDHRVFVLDQWVFVLDQWVFVLDHRVFVLDQWVFVLDHRVFVLDHRVLGLRSSFLGLRVRNTRKLNHFKIKLCAIVSISRLIISSLVFTLNIHTGETHPVTQSLCMNGFKVNIENVVMMLTFSSIETQNLIVSP